MKTAPQVHSRGFSLLELLAVVTILGIIAAIVLPRMSASESTAREKVRQHHLATINAAVERYHVEHGRWPADDLSDIAADVRYFPDGMPEDPTSGAPYRLDSQSHRAE